MAVAVGAAVFVLGLVFDLFVFHRFIFSFSGNDSGRGIASDAIWVRKFDNVVWLANRAPDWGETESQAT